MRHTVLFGGVNMDKQTADLRTGCEIVVATVGRLLDHVKQKNINLNKVEIVVLDEADRMLDMGFHRRYPQNHADVAQTATNPAFLRHFLTAYPQACTRFYAYA